MHDRASTLVLDPSPVGLSASAASLADAPDAAPPTAPLAPSPVAGRRCPLCGYRLHGLPDAALCPECGHDPSEAPLPPLQSDADVWWARCVASGLILLLVTSFVMLGVTVYMRFRSEWAGSLPVVNFAGPKLWGTALLQRSIGSAPGEWGVAGTRFGLLGLLAIWLITARRPADALAEPLLSLRRLTRWVALLGFGAMFGLLLGEDGVSYWGSDDRDPYFMLLISLVELPATTLLYVYLRQVATTLHDRPLRQSLNVLSFAVPACIGGAVLVFLLGDVWREAKHQLPQQMLVAGYGAACVGLGALATACIARLTLLLLPATLGGASTLGVRQFVLDIYRRAKLQATLRSDAWPRWITAVGLVGWLLLSASLVQAVLMLDFRTGVGGNWPMVNVPGPKVWAVPAVERLHPFSDQTGSVLGSLVLLAGVLWLVTIRRDERPERWYSSRRLARWGPTTLLGMALGIVLGLGRDLAPIQTWSIYSAYTLPLTMFVEAPATLAVYLYLAVLARQQSDLRLSRHLAWAGLIVTTLILGGNGMFLLSRLHVAGGWLPGVIVAAYGTACVSAGLWATWCVLRLLRTLILPAEPKPDAQLSLFPA